MESDAILEEIDAHSLGHRTYTGGWYELACNGCDVFKGKRYSHLDMEGRHAKHRREVFAALLAAHTIGSHRELVDLPEGAAVLTSDVSDTVVLKGSGDFFVNQSGYEVDSMTLWVYGQHPLTILWKGSE